MAIPSTNRSQRQFNPRSNSGLLHPLTPLPPSLMHSSTITTHAETLAVQRVIQQSKLSLSRIDEDIQRLEASLAFLKSQRSVVEQHIEEHEAVLAPVRRLPPEVLSEIFLWSQAGRAFSWPGALRSESVADSPWKLGQVCSYWRGVFTSLPKLWSTIHLDLSTLRLPESVLSHMTHLQAHEFLKTCLARSKLELLTFTLRYQPSDDPERVYDDKTGELACSLLSVLAESSERWEGVTLDLEDFFTFHSVLSSTRNRVPHLRALHLASSGASGSTPRPWQAIDAFFDAPQLTRLTLNNIAHPTHHLRMPWSQLKSIRSRGSTFLEGEFSRILKEATLLEEFATEDERVLEVAASGLQLPLPGSTSSSSSGVYLPNLHTLSVTNKSSYISRIFQLITAPSLTTLSIHARTALSNPEPILTMLRRSCASLQLRTLVLETSKDPEAVWEENYGVVFILAEVKGVRECVLRVCRSVDEIVPRLSVRQGVGASPVRHSAGPPSFHYLSGNGGIMNGGYGGVTYAGSTRSGSGGSAGTILLPNLHTFELHDSFCVSTTGLRDMLQSRIINSTVPLRDGDDDDPVPEFGGTTRLRKVRLELSRPAPPKYTELEELKNLVADKGVDMSISV